jgi:amino acid permease
MDRKKILYTGIAIVIALFSYLCYCFIEKNNKIQKEKLIQVEIKKQIDSLRILNNYLETLNKKDGTAIKDIEKNIIKNDSIINTLSLQQLQKLLSK